MARSVVPTSGLWSNLSSLMNSNYEELYDAIQYSPNFVIVNSVDDFTSQTASTITLESGKTYIAGANISTSKYFILEPNVNIFSYGFGSNIWEYTGSGSMFVGNDIQSLNIVRLGYRCPNAQIFNITDTTPNISIVNLDTMIGVASSPTSLVCEKFGTFTNILSLVIYNSAAYAGAGTNNGITMSGVYAILSINQLAFNSINTSFIGLDLGTSVSVAAFELRNFLNQAPAGAVGISGQTNSANISPNLLGIIRDSEFLGGITPLNGLNNSDIYFEFDNNSGIADSVKAGETYISASQTVTINTQNVFETVVGTNWVDDISERLTITNNGQVTIDSPGQSQYKVEVSATVTKVGGGSDEIILAIAINGVEQPKTYSSTQNSNPTNLNSSGLFNLSQGDVVTIKVANANSSSNIILSRANVVITNGY